MPILLSIWGKSQKLRMAKIQEVSGGALHRHSLRGYINQEEF